MAREKVSIGTESFFRLLSLPFSLYLTSKLRSSNSIYQDWLLFNTGNLFK
ncbi:hypothetical protein NC651_011200 [Populus alba x Populus x berolinensis]|nr:hypothetical protein NC651_011200 [Populus alba x Populus x berolinensis]